MISFLRKIRRGLLNENRIGKYLLYALGEIALVVIGILIALQVNNYNEERKKLKRKDEVLLQVQNDLVRNLGDLRADLDMHRLGLQSNLKVTRHMEASLPYDPELAFDFWYLKGDEYTTPSTTGYENLKSLGLGTVKNERLQNMIKSIYESLYPRLSKEFELFPDISNYFSDYYLNHFEPLTDTTLTHELIVDSDTIPFPLKYKIEDMPITRHIGYVPLDYEALREDPKFRMMLRESQDFRIYKLHRYRSLIQLTDEAIDLIGMEVGSITR